MPQKDKAEYNAYMSTYMLARYHRRRKQVIEQLGGKCVTCGGIEDLQIDHWDAKKKSFGITERLAGYSDANLASEIEKCQLLCQPCHQAKTLVDLGMKQAKGFHGTISTYRYCKCELCRAAKNATMSKYRAARRLKYGTDR